MGLLLGRERSGCGVGAEGDAGSEHRWGEGWQGETSADSLPLNIPSSLSGGSRGLPRGPSRKAPLGGKDPNPPGTCEPGAALFPGCCSSREAWNPESQFPGLGIPHGAPRTGACSSGWSLSRPGLVLKQIKCRGALGR